MSVSVFAAALAVLAVAGLAWARAAWARRARHWAARGVPSEPRAGPHPLLGSLTALYRENFGLWMKAMYESHPGEPYVGIWLLWRPALVVHSPELAGRILVKDSANFRDHSHGVSARVDPMGALNVFVLREPMWSRVRRRLTTMFTMAKLRALHSIHSTKSNEIIRRIQKHNDDGTSLELRSLFADYATDVIGAVTLGVAGEAAATGQSALRTVTGHFMEFSVWRGFCWASIFFCPPVASLCGCSLFPRAATSRLRRLLAATSAAGGELRAAMDKLREDGKRGEIECTDDLLAAQAVILVQGGFDTTASALAFTVYELTYHPDIQERLYGEVRGAADALGHADLDAVTLGQLPYLKACIKETLRKYPPLGWLERRCAAEYRLDERVTLRPGDTVYINGNGLHYDPRYFPDPDRFDPDRFLPENEASIPPFTYMPFGEGPRICIGMRFAEVASRHLLARLLLAFRLVPAAGQPPPNLLQLEKRGLFMMPGQPMYVRFEPRS